MSNLELEMVIKNSFLDAFKVGFDPILVKPSPLIIKSVPWIRFINLENFSDVVETNIALASNILDDFDPILRVDPDEEFSIRCLQDIFEITTTLTPDEVGLIRLQYFFSGRPLRGTPWGGIREFPRVGFKENFSKIYLVHSRIKANSTKLCSNEVVNHYWADSIEEIRLKHDRYLAKEGEARFESYGNWNLASSIMRILKVLFGVVRRIAITDGLTGLKLSKEFCSYALRAEIEHKKYSKFMKLASF